MQRGSVGKRQVLNLPVCSVRRQAVEARVGHARAGVVYSGQRIEPRIPRGILAGLEFRQDLEEDAEKG